MKNVTKLILCISIITLTSFSKTEVSRDVYICGENGAKRYHYSKNCQGLSNCKKGKFKVSLSDAKSKGLTLCGWED